MSRTTILAALCASALLAACEAKIGKDADEPTAQANGAAVAVSAEGKAEEGQFSIDAPGFDLKFNIPEGLTDHAVESDSEMLYPGASLSGMHIEAGEDAGGQDRGAVELRFTSSDAPAKVAAWYRDPARASDLTVVSARQEGVNFIIEGRHAGDSDPFKVLLGPSEGGGTDGRLILSDKG